MRRVVGLKLPSLRQRRGFGDSRYSKIRGSNRRRRGKIDPLFGRHRRDQRDSRCECLNEEVPTSLLLDVNSCAS